MPILTDDQLFNTAEREEFQRYGFEPNAADVLDYDRIIHEANTMATIPGRRGLAARRQSRDPRYIKRLTETATFMKNVAAGRVSTLALQEIMSTSDFPILFGDVLDRKLLNNYGAAPVSWPSFFDRGTVPDFRATRLIAIDGLQAPFDHKKEELTDVKYDNNVAETAYTTQVNVYEKGFALNWRMLVNRSLNFVSRLPQLLATGARRTEEYLAADLLADSTGPDSTFFSVAHANIVSGNPALSTTGLKAAFNTLYAQTDPDGNPIEITAATLVVPPLLQITAREVLKAVSLEYFTDMTADGMKIVTPNWASGLKLSVNWYLPVIDQSANRHTTWYLFADPSTTRPAGQVTFLEGYEEPSFWQKAPDTMRMGTGTVNPLLGDFEDMSLKYKGLHILGGTLGDYRAAVVSNGSGA